MFDHAVRAILVGLLIGSASACASGDNAAEIVPADQSGFDHSSFDPRPHDYRTLGLDRLSGTIRPTTVLMTNERDLCGEGEFPFDHTFYIADQIHTAWHIYEEDSPRTFDNVVVTITEYAMVLECHPHPKNPEDLQCITQIDLGVDLLTEGGGGSTLKDHGWAGFYWVSFPESCAEANHRLDFVASKATAGAISELFKSVEQTDAEMLP